VCELGNISEKICYFLCTEVLSWIWGCMDMK
jgi:hypothetical protein